MTEELAYEVVQAYEGFELRRYPAYVVAEVVVGGDFEEAGGAAFRTLFGYISGQNRSTTKLAMTSPVIQRDSQPIAMTTPVQQRATHTGEYAVAFVLPSSLTLADAPVPMSPEVTLHERAEVLAAAHRYRGRWTEVSFEQHIEQLRSAVTGAGLTLVGSPRWARFDPPYVPWLLRRNEIVQDVGADAGGLTRPDPSTPTPT
ncbi:heme-binding protein [Dermatophilaceae bacterium Soc4.6]